MAPRRKDFGPALQDHLRALASPENRDTHLIDQATHGLTQSPGELAPYELLRFRTMSSLISQLALSPKGNIAFVGKRDSKYVGVDLWTGSIHRPDELDKRLTAVIAITHLQFPDSRFSSSCACLYQEDDGMYVYWDTGIWNAKLDFRIRSKDILQVVFWHNEPSDFFCGIVRKSGKDVICEVFTRNGVTETHRVRRHFLPGWQPRIVDTTTDEECLLYRKAEIGVHPGQPAFYYYKGHRTSEMIYSDNPVLLDPKEKRVLAAIGFDPRERRHAIFQARDMAQGHQVTHFGNEMLDGENQAIGASVIARNGDYYIVRPMTADPQEEPGSWVITKKSSGFSGVHSDFTVNGGADELFVLDDGTLIAVNTNDPVNCSDGAGVSIMSADGKQSSWLEAKSLVPGSFDDASMFRNDGDRFLIASKIGIQWLTADQLFMSTNKGQWTALPSYGLRADQIVRHEKGYLISVSHVGAGQISVRRYLPRDFDALFED